MNPQVAATAREVNKYMARTPMGLPALTVKTHAPAWVMVFASGLERFVIDHWTSEVIVRMVRAISELTEEDIYENSPTVNSLSETLTKPQFTELDRDAICWMLDWTYGGTRVSVTNAMDEQGHVGDPLELIRHAEAEERHMLWHFVWRCLDEVTKFSANENPDFNIAVGAYDDDDD